MLTMKKPTLSIIATAVGIVGTLLTGCQTTKPSQPNATPQPEVRAIGHNPIAHLSDLIALTNSLSGTRRAAYFTFELNDQSTQPFKGSAGSAQDRANFPMWTDVVLTGVCTNIATGEGHKVFEISTVTYKNGREDVTLGDPDPRYSVEIPGLYRNTPDPRYNVRIDYTKYSSVAHFLYANGMEDRVFDDLQSANQSYRLVKADDPEAGHWYDVFCNYVPKTFMLKVDFAAFEGLDDVHNENVRLYFSYNRCVGGMKRETAKVVENGQNVEKLVWTPIFPRWVRTPFFNEFAKGDVE